MKRQNFLVTGGAGFIGSHLVDALLECGHIVTVLDDLSVGKTQNFAHHLAHPHFHFVQGSILDKALVTQLVAQVDGIYHLAAVVGVKYVVEDPLRGMQVNVRGTETILEAACERGCKVVLASSSETYGKSSCVPFAEEDATVIGPTSVPRWAYAISKLLDEHLAFAYYRQKGLPATAVRYFNAYGPRLDPRGYGSVIPALSIKRSRVRRSQFMGMDNKRARSPSSPIRCVAPSQRWKHRRAPDKHSTSVIHVR